MLRFALWLLAVALKFSKPNIWLRGIYIGSTRHFERKLLISQDGNREVIIKILSVDSGTVGILDFIHLIPDYI
jgi:hypothetical protein